MNRGKVSLPLLFGILFIVATGLMYFFITRHSQDLEKIKMYQELAETESQKFNDAKKKFENAKGYIVELEKKAGQQDSTIADLNAKIKSIKYVVGKEISGKYEEKLKKLKEEVTDKEELLTLTLTLCEEEKDEFALNLSLCHEKDETTDKLLKSLGIKYGLISEINEELKLTSGEIENLFDSANRKREACMKDRLDKIRYIEKQKKTISFWKSVSVGAIVAGLIVIVAN